MNTGSQPYEDWMSKSEACRFVSQRLFPKISGKSGGRDAQLVKGHSLLRTPIGNGDIKTKLKAGRTFLWREDLHAWMMRYACWKKLRVDVNDLHAPGPVAGAASLMHLNLLNIPPFPMPDDLDDHQLREAYPALLAAYLRTRDALRAALQREHEAHRKRVEAGGKRGVW